MSRSSSPDSLFSVFSTESAEIIEHGSAHAEMLETVALSSTPPIEGMYVIRDILTSDLVRESRRLPH